MLLLGICAWVFEHASSGARLTKVFKVFLSLAKGNKNSVVMAAWLPQRKMKEKKEYFISYKKDKETSTMIQEVV